MGFCLLKIFKNAGDLAGVPRSDAFYMVFVGWYLILTVGILSWFSSDTNADTWKFQIAVLCGMVWYLGIAAVFAYDKLAVMGHKFQFGGHDSYQFDVLMLGNLILRLAIIDDFSVPSFKKVQDAGLSINASPLMILIAYTIAVSMVVLVLIAALKTRRDGGQVASLIKYENAWVNAFDRAMAEDEATAFDVATKLPKGFDPIDNGFLLAEQERSKLSYTPAWCVVAVKLLLIGIIVGGVWWISEEGQVNWGTLGGIIGLIGCFLVLGISIAKGRNVKGRHVSPG